MPDPQNPLRVLVAEGSSTSAGRWLRFWVCRAIPSRSAIPRPGAFRGSRSWSENFTAARDCGMTPPAIWPSSSSGWLRRNSMCCCRRMSRDFCLPGRSRASKAARVSRCRVLRITAPRTARPGSARLLW